MKLGIFGRSNGQGRDERDRLLTREFEDRYRQQNEDAPGVIRLDG